MANPMTAPSGEAIRRQVEAARAYCEQWRADFPVLSEVLSEMDAAAELAEDDRRLAALDAYARLRETGPIGGGNPLGNCPRCFGTGSCELTLGESAALAQAVTDLQSAQLPGDARARRDRPAMSTSVASILADECHEAARKLNVTVPLGAYHSTGILLEKVAVFLDASAPPESTDAAVIRELRAWLTDERKRHGSVLRRLQIDDVLAKLDALTGAKP